jgi:hypothetical protein
MIYPRAPDPEAFILGRRTLPPTSFPSFSRKKTYKNKNVTKDKLNQYKEKGLQKSYSFLYKGSVSDPVLIGSANPDMNLIINFLQIFRNKSLFRSRSAFRSRIGSVFSNRLDPDSDSVSKNSKHCKKVRSGSDLTK